jgi:hypothetical protein
MNNDEYLLKSEKKKEYTKYGSTIVIKKNRVSGVIIIIMIGD